MNISIPLSEEEKNLAERYASKHGLSLEEAFKSALFGAIEDEHELEAYEKAIKEFEQNPKAYSLDEVERFLDLKE